MASTIPPTTRFVYPSSKRSDHVDVYHGQTIADPYRWLEMPDSEDTKAWVTQQNAVTNAHLTSPSCSSIRDHVTTRMKELCNYERYSCPFRRGDRYFFLKNDGLQNQSVFYKQDSLDGKAEVLLDPNVLAADGTSSLGAYEISEDGRYFAYGVSKSGSDWQTVYVRDVASSTDLPVDSIPWVKFSGISWTHDHKGFYYSKYPAPVEAATGQSAGTETSAVARQTLWYHAIGTSVDLDIQIYSPTDATWMVSGQVSDDGKYLLITINDSCDPVNRLYYSVINGDIKADAPIIKLIDNFEAEYSYITNDATLFYFKTNLNAPRYRVIAIDFTAPDVSHWKEIIGHSDDVLSYAVPVHQNLLVLAYMQHVKHVLKVYNLSGEESKTQISLPSLGAIAGLSARRQDRELFYKFVSFLYPGSAFRVDLSTGITHPFRETVVKGFDASLYQVDQVFYDSADAKVPMFIIRAKSTVLDGKNPTLLYGYGGFNIALMPSFSIGRLIWVMHLGGILAIPNIRGGGEYGDAWHKAGVLGKKQNVFNDFIAAAEFLIASKYTNASKLGIEGGSNGGLLVGACANQRPDLFGAAIAHVGVMDMLRFHKFTIGYAWCSDYGSSDIKEQFEFLIKYSPIHNVPGDKVFPSLLLLTADHDDRVSPLHSYKYIAEVQHKLGNNVNQTSPLMIRIETKAGHGGGKPLAKQIEEQSDVYGFVSAALGASWR